MVDGGAVMEGGWLVAVDVMVNGGCGEDMVTPNHHLDFDGGLWKNLCPSPSMLQFQFQAFSYFNLIAFAISTLLRHELVLAVDP
ncbi:hypothetical protein RJT34_07294 [Clitoria ternatea]|uniref:Uncharacterized protein n=1 Tax=Clitoria ternatea TaxID=43366 RepID=A0AAN9PU53_CLITE